MSDCPICQQPGLTWTKTSRGKNWLKDSKGKWHNCPLKGGASNRKTPKYHCPNCPRSFGWGLTPNEIEHHKKIYHPHNETYDIDDIKHGEHTAIASRLWYYQPNYLKKEHL